MTKYTLHGNEISFDLKDIEEYLLESITESLRKKHDNNEIALFTQKINFSFEKNSFGEFNISGQLNIFRRQ